LVEAGGFSPRNYSEIERPSGLGSLHLTAEGLIYFVNANVSASRAIFVCSPLAKFFTVRIPD
jgi:hypothetical protein